MPHFERHVFVCINERPAGSARGCCAEKGSRRIRARLKELAKQAGLQDRVRINASGCLDQCERGVTVVVYPEGVWYGAVTLEDVDELFAEHVVGGRAVQRLRLPATKEADDGAA